MLVSIVIPTCNRNDLLSNCLDLLHQNINSCIVDCEVIVSDDSKDNIAKPLIIENYNWVTWISGPKRGPAANRNNGAANAKGDWLIFLDDDCLPQKDWLSSYLTSIKLNRDILVLEGATNADRPKQRFDEEAPINLDGNKLWSCNFAIKKDFFDRLVGFDETFPFAAMEDVDFYTKVANQTKIRFVQEALVIHPWRRIKPFKNFQKHLKSQKHFAIKYGLLKGLDFRWTRVKIFIGGIFIDFKDLLSFSMRGWFFYLEKVALNFCLIFI